MKLQTRAFLDCKRCGNAMGVQYYMAEFEDFGIPKNDAVCLRCFYKGESKK